MKRTRATTHDLEKAFRLKAYQTGFNVFFETLLFLLNCVRLDINMKAKVIVTINHDCYTLPSVTGGVRLSVPLSRKHKRKDAAGLMFTLSTGIGWSP